MWVTEGEDDGFADDNSDWPVQEIVIAYKSMWCKLNHIIARINAATVKNSVGIVIAATGGEELFFVVVLVEVLEESVVVIKSVSE